MEQNEKNVEIKRKLNIYQEAAVQDESPACIVNANVGSGKTTVLTEKVQYLHEKKQVPYEKMAVLTFTNRAADEIAERLARNEVKELEEEQFWGFGTFHSVALRLLRKFLSEPDESACADQSTDANEEGTFSNVNKYVVTNESEKAVWRQDFAVIEPEEEMEMILNLASEHGYKIKYQNRLKSRMEPDYEAYLQGKEKGKYKDDLFKVFPLLEKQKKLENKMSFADLLREGNRIAREHQEEIGLEWIIVDEIQDSDRKQLEFLEALKGEGTYTKFFAVGDPNQVIYSWRGTEPNMFFLIKNRFEAKELTLPVNYRSTEVILEAANHFMQFGGKIEGRLERGDKILVKNHYDPFMEAEYLVERIRELIAKGMDYSQIAIFYRVKKQAEILEKVFEREGIPFEFPAKRNEDDELVPERPRMIREGIAKGSSNIKVSEPTEETEALNKTGAENFDASVVDSGKSEADDSKKSENSVHLLTLHASKGLEFDYVFIIGMNPGLIPLRCKNMEQEEEERRLFFVGLTRARNNLELSYYTNPTIPGALEGPSKYLQMIPETLLDWEDRPGSDARKANLQKMRREAGKLVRGRQTGQSTAYDEPLQKRESASQSNFTLKDNEKVSNERRGASQNNIASGHNEQAGNEQASNEQRSDVPGNAETAGERLGRHPKYGEGVIISEDKMMIELEFPGYGRKQFLKAFGEISYL